MQTMLKVIVNERTNSRREPQKATQLGHIMLAGAFGRQDQEK